MTLRIPLLGTDDLLQKIHNTVVYAVQCFKSKLAQRQMREVLPYLMSVKEEIK